MVNVTVSNAKQRCWDRTACPPGRTVTGTKGRLAKIAFFPYRQIAYTSRVVIGRRIVGWSPLNVILDSIPFNIATNISC